MNLNIQIPDNTALIFEYMQKGQFICSNSTDIDLRDMYNMIDENYESLYQYFSQINYTSLIPQHYSLTLFISA